MRQTHKCWSLFSIHDAYDNVTVNGKAEKKLLWEFPIYSINVECRIFIVKIMQKLENVELL